MSPVLSSPATNILECIHTCIKCLPHNWHVHGLFWGRGSSGWVSSCLVWADCVGNPLLQWRHLHRIKIKYTNLEFCQQKLTSPPLGLISHLVHRCWLYYLRSEQREEEESETWTNKKSPPPYGRGRLDECQKWRIPLHRS